MFTYETVEEPQTRQHLRIEGTSPFQCSFATAVKRVKRATCQGSRSLFELKSTILLTLLAHASDPKTSAAKRGSRS